MRWPLSADRRGRNIAARAAPVRPLGLRSSRSGREESRSMTKKSPDTLRSARWFAPDDLRSFGHRSRMNQMGYAVEEFQGKPIIGIVNTWSDFAQCHAHFKHRVEDVKRGVLQGGGFPVELPAISLSESTVKPTTMLYRNFLAMETEELIRSQPVDGVVLMGGCDKTTPGLILGATSADVPAIYVPAGPMLRGNWHGQTLGSGSDAFKYWDERRAGNISAKDWGEMEMGIARSYGVCMTMGTASTMTALADVIGLSLPGTSSIPAADSNHVRMCSAAGRRIVEMVWEDLTPARILSEGAFRNAIIVAMAMGCSTNAVIHLIAMARRAGQSIGLEDFDAASRRVPVIAYIRPSGDKYLMEDFYYAGGLVGLISRLKSFLDLSQINVSGKTWAESLQGAAVYDDDGSLKGSIDRDDLDVTPDHVLVLRNAGPQGGPGMPEWGMIPIPTKLVKRGVRDMIRISDARMSGTSYGACILHV